MQKSEPPHYRGVFKCFGRLGVRTEIDRASFRFLAKRKNQKRSFWVSLISVYGAKDSTNVVFSTPQRQKKLSRFFIKSRFPFLSNTADKPFTYKSLHFGFGWDFLVDTCHLEISFERSGQMKVTRALEIETVENIEILRPTKEFFAEIEDFFSNSLHSEISKSKAAKYKIALDTIERKNGESIELLRAKIIQDVALLANHKRAYCNLEKLSKLIDKDEFGYFTDRLVALNPPLNLGRHGYYPSFVDLDISQVEIELKRLFSILDDFNIPSFINSGTLLGYIRDGRPIARDDDFDIAVVIPGEDTNTVAINWKKFKRDLGEIFAVIDKGSFVAIQLDMGVQVDIFASWVKDDRFFVYPYCYGDVPKIAALPIRTLTIRGNELPIPNDPESLLVANYTENWRKPDPFWRFDWSRAKRRFRKELVKLKGV